MLKLRKFQAGEPLVIAMTAVRMGDRLLVIGCRAPKVIAQLAGKPGITGRTCAVDDSAARTAGAAAAAQREGALLEVETVSLGNLPFANETFDVVVVNHLLPYLSIDQQNASLREGARVLRAGGRCVVLQAGHRTAVAALFSAAPQMAAADIEAVMTAAGFRAVRTIAEREGLQFVEGAKRNEG